MITFLAERGEGESGMNSCAARVITTCTLEVFLLRRVVNQLGGFVLCYAFADAQCDSVLPGRR